VPTGTAGISIKTRSI